MKEGIILVPFASRDQGLNLDIADAIQERNARGVSWEVRSEPLKGRLPVSSQGRDVGITERPKGVVKSICCTNRKDNGDSLTTSAYTRDSLSSTSSIFP